MVDVINKFVLYKYISSYENVNQRHYWIIISEVSFWTKTVRVDVREMLYNCVRQIETDKYDGKNINLQSCLRQKKMNTK